MKRKLLGVLIHFFTEIGLNLAKEIETHTIKFDDYLEQPDNPVSINEL